MNIEERIQQAEAKNRELQELMFGVALAFVDLALSMSGHRVAEIEGEVARLRARYAEPRDGRRGRKA